MQKWEYQRVLETQTSADREFDTQIDLTKFGEDGWELISAVPISNYHHLGSSGTTNQLLYFFKRPKE
jgi:hypothetical protein